MNSDYDETEPQPQMAQPVRRFRVSNASMDKDMFNQLIHEFNGNVDLHGIAFSDVAPPRRREGG